MNPHYEKIGGEAALHKLVERFYHHMDHDDAFRGIRQMHPQDLSGSREKLFMFLSGWMGGPPLYTEQNGPPRLRQRHIPFPIGGDEVEQWLDCMQRALAETVEDPAFQAELMESFHKVARSMQNQGEGQPQIFS